MTDNGMRYDAKSHVLAIEARVGGLETRIGELATQTEKQFNTVLSKLDQRSQTNWGVLISAGTLILGVLTALGVALWSPVQNNLARLENGLIGLERTTISRGESDMWAKVRESQFSRLEEHDADLRKRLERLETKVFGL